MHWPRRCRCPWLAHIGGGQAGASFTPSPTMSDGVAHRRPSCCSWRTATALSPGSTGHDLVWPRAAGPGRRHGSAAPRLSPDTMTQALPRAPQQRQRLACAGRVRRSSASSACKAFFVPTRDSGNALDQGRDGSAPSRCHSATCACSGPRCPPVPPSSAGCQPERCACPFAPDLPRPG